MAASESLSFEEAQQLQRQQMVSDPRYWIRHNWVHPNDIERSYDFRTNDGEPLTYLVDDKGPLNPEEWADINILKLARGCLKTTSLIGINEWALDSFPQCEAFMTAPQSDATHEFSSKFKDLVHDTALEPKRVRDRFSHQKFEHTIIDPETGDETTSFSHFKSKSAWNADDGLRGPHSHIGVIDEYQDVDRKTLTMMLEIVDREIPNVPYFPVIFLIGTPKLKNSEFHDKWEQSNQRVWDQDAQAWIDNSDVGTITAGDGDDDETFTIKGWEIDQYNCPLHDPARIEFKKQDRTEREFANEVLAQFYSPEDDLLSEQHVRAAFDDGGFRNSRQFDPPHSEVLITADWGGGSGAQAADTVFTAAEVTEIGNGPRDYQCRLLNVEFVDHDVTGNEEEELVAQWIRRYQADHVLVDEGHNGTRRESLQEMFPGLVHGVFFGNPMPAEDVRWNRDEAERKVFAVVNKSYVAESFVDAFKDEKFVIPQDDLVFDTKRSSGWKLINQLTAPYKDYDESVTGRKSLKVLTDDTANDDAFDAFVYLWCGIEHVHKGAELTEFHLESMQGY